MSYIIIIHSNNLISVNINKRKRKKKKGKKMGLKDIERKEEKKEKKIYVKSDTVKILIAAILLLIIFIASYFLFFIPKKEITENEILRITQQESVVKDFISKNPKYERRITFLTKQNVTSLSENFPALYGDLPKIDLYRVEYVSGEDGIFIILDKNLKVLKYFKVYSLGLGSLQI